LFTLEEKADFHLRQDLSTEWLLAQIPLNRDEIIDKNEKIYYIGLL
jgi:hypothetical protein